MNLIPLSQLPYSARAEESEERAKWPTRAMALDAATIKIVSAPGCYSDAIPPTIGWVLTLSAARALCEQVTTMPGGTCHHRLAYVDGYHSTDALDEYMQAIADGADKDAAVAAYKAATE